MWPNAGRLPAPSARCGNSIPGASPNAFRHRFLSGCLLGRVDLAARLLIQQTGSRQDAGVRPDQHIAWRATDPADIDLDLVTGHTPSA
jgi:hypothetical protein